MKILITVLCLMFTAPAWATEIPDADSAAAQLFAQHCSACHALPSPRRLDWSHWRNILHMMKQRMDERGVSEPPPDEWRQIAGYLKSHARGK